jgi:hypothetical protein
VRKLSTVTADRIIAPHSWSPSRVRRSEGSRYIALRVVPPREEVALPEVFDDGISEWAA